MTKLLALGFCVVAAVGMRMPELEAAELLSLNLRSRLQPDIARPTDTANQKDTDNEKDTVQPDAVVHRRVEWDPAKTAIIVCDMWDQHWCNGAERRVAELAGPMNDVLKQARQRGMFIIHAPSTTVDFYRDTPQRRRAMEAKFTKTSLPLETRGRWGTAWCWPDERREPGLPIDDYDMGCDCATTGAGACEIRSPWTRQITTIEIGDNDAITDNGQETFNLLGERGIDNVLIMGVHLNMCVLGRPFAIRQLVAQGKNVVLVRDLTDTMYNSQQMPRVDHFQGTDLVVAHVERNWCPTVSSTDLSSTGLSGAAEFRFAEDKRPHVVMMIGEDEYETERTLPTFAARELEPRGMRTTIVMADQARPHDFAGMAALDSADLLLVSVRRRFPAEADIERIKKFVAAGKPVVGIRTASHAFLGRDGARPPAGHAAWPEFDRDVLGGNYTGHHGNKEESAPRTFVQIADDAKKHPIVDGLPTMEFETKSWLYKTSPLASTTELLLTGRVEGREPAEPVAWTNVNGKQRVFYTSLGHSADFEADAFRRLLVQGIFWSLDRDVPSPKPAYRAPLAKPEPAAR